MCISLELSSIFIVSLSLPLSGHLCLKIGLKVRLDEPVLSHRIRNEETQKKQIIIFNWNVILKTILIVFFKRINTGNQR